MNRIGGRTTLACVCIAVVSAGCGGVERGTPVQADRAGGSTQDAAGGASTGDAAADGSGGLPSTSSLFRTIDDMQAHPGLPTIPGPSPSASFWWILGPLGNWFFGSAGADPGPRGGDALASDAFPPARRSCQPGACWSRHVQGDQLSNGVDMTAQLRHPSNEPVDLRSYAGVAFWARLASPSGRLVVTLKDTGTSAQSFLVAESSPSPWFAQSVAVADQWQRFVLLFDDFHQGVLSGSSSGRALDLAAVTNIDFVVGLGGESFDLLIHDLALLCRGVCPVAPCPFPLEEDEAGARTCP